MGYRATGMSLDAIHKILQDEANSTEHLLAQRDMLQRKIAAYGRMLETIRTVFWRNTMAPKMSSSPLPKKQRLWVKGSASPTSRKRRSVT